MKSKFLFRRRIWFSFFFSLFLFSCQELQSPKTYERQLEQMPSLSISVVDGAGRKLTFSSPPKRLAVLSPDVAEVISYYGKANNVVVTTSLCQSYFPNTPTLYVFPSLEIQDISEFRPDLVLAGGFYFDTTIISAIRDLNYPIYYFNPTSINDLLHQLYMIGLLLDMPEQAKKLMDSLAKEIKRIQNATDSTARYKVLFYIDVQKGTVIGGRHLVSSFLEICHVENLANSPYAYATIQPQDLLQSGVEIIFIPDGSMEEFNNLLLTYPQLAELPAIKQNQVIQYDPETVFIYSQRITESIAYLLSAIHPHVYGKLYAH